MVFWILVLSSPSSFFAFASFYFFSSAILSFAACSLPYSLDNLAWSFSALSSFAFTFLAVPIYFFRSDGYFGLPPTFKSLLASSFPLSCSVFAGFFSSFDKGPVSDLVYSGIFFFLSSRIFFAFATAFLAASMLLALGATLAS